METQNFFFVPRSWQDEINIFLYFFTELKTYHLSHFYLQPLILFYKFCIKNIINTYYS